MASFGPGGSESKSSSRINVFDQRVAAADQGVIDAQRVHAGDHSTALGPGATQLNTRGGDLHLEYSSDPDLLRAAIDSVSDQSDDFSRSLTAIFAAASDAQTALAIGNAVSQKTLLENTFDQLSDLAKSQQSGGETDRNKIVLWISLAALATVGAAFLFG